MATKKKAKKKAVRKAVAFRKDRVLSVDLLRRYGACFPARLAFATGFHSFDDVAISERLITHSIGNDRLEQLRPLIGGEGWVMEYKGRQLFQRKLANEGLSASRLTDAASLRRYFVLFARYFVRYPAKPWCS